MKSFMLIDQMNALNGSEYNCIERFKLTDQNLFQHDVNVRSGFDVHNGRLITTVTFSQ
jgi:hypothetical protein